MRLTYFYRQKPLELEELLKFLVTEEFPRAHLFIDEIPVTGHNQHLFKGVNLQGKVVTSLELFSMF